MTETNVIRDEYFDNVVDTGAIIADLAHKASNATRVEDGKLYVIPTEDGGYELLETPRYSKGLEADYADSPRQIRRAVTLLDVQSFVEYLGRNGSWEEGGPLYRHGTGELEVWADIDRRRVFAILDGINGWKQHNATLALKLSREWGEWTGIDGKMLDQVTFAQFIEDHMTTIAHPDAGTLLDICQTLDVSSGAKFKQENILANGQRKFKFEETIEAKAGQKGDLTIPGEITLGLRPFQGSEQIGVQARFRFQVREGNLSLGIRLAEPANILENAFNQIVDEVAELVPAPIMQGSPTQ